MLIDLRPMAARELGGEQVDITMQARFEILGLCPKCLRVLDIPHFSECLLNPGVGRILDLNLFLPWTEEWFSQGIDHENYRTTHLGVKNENNKYIPNWLKPSQSIR